MPWYFSGACLGNHHYSGCLQGHSCYTAVASSAIVLEERTLGRALGPSRHRVLLLPTLERHKACGPLGSIQPPVLLAASCAKESLGSTRIPSNCFLLTSFYPILKTKAHRG